ncbi:hypothetical protein LSA_02490 [Fructilactobacillus sanfranciscensis TMW 1.1304]|uniref:Uncharacterized protein n=1 Tax=Fructilactobacillus sanfranciscensis (strain TMW 1.1304) TaxID=714313 RepID=G2KVB0_FRUST|nr:hypothetical protein LSA_02490 [Fructilactobacillus sanfranciscensis TMW 1.1304]
MLLFCRHSLLRQDAVCTRCVIYRNQSLQDASTSLMSVIGMILLAILGLFGLDGFKKRNENK